MTTATAPPRTAHRAFRVCLDPTSAQRTVLAKHAGAARVAYNYAVTAQQQAWEQRRAVITEHLAAGADEATARRAAPTVPSAYDLQKRFNRERGDDTRGQDGVFPWWREVSSYVFSSARADAAAAFRNWITSWSGQRPGRRMGAPRKKKKGRSRDSYRIYHPRRKPTIRLDGYRRLLIPKHGSLRVHNNTRRVARLLARGGEITSVTVSRGGDRWYASILVEYPQHAVQPTQAQRATGRVGVDIGTHHLAALSDGTTIPNPRHLRRSRAVLARAQRSLARTQNRSRRHRKARNRLGRLHHRLAERRAGYLHQLTKHLATGWAEVAVEDLNVAGMTASARGTRERPGTRVRQKAGLNRSMLDVAPGELRRQLAYKTSWYGSTLAVCDRWYPSSKTCSHCGAAKATLPLHERVFHCTTCGARLDRDINAARNIATAAVPVHHDAAVAPDSGSTIKARPSAGHCPAEQEHTGAMTRVDHAPPRGRGHPRPARAWRSPPTPRRTNDT